MVSSFTSLPGQSTRQGFVKASSSFASQPGASVSSSREAPTARQAGINISTQRTGDCGLSFLLMLASMASCCATAIGLPIWLATKGPAIFKRLKAALPQGNLKEELAKPSTYARLASVTGEVATGLKKGH